MKEFSKNETLICIYCGDKHDEGSDLKAIDFIPPVPNFEGPIDYDNPQYQHSVQDEQCSYCDQTFYLRFNEEDKVIVANLPSKLY